MKLRTRVTKKILSILMAMLMMFSIASMAFADNETVEDIPDNETVEEDPEDEETEDEEDEEETEDDEETEDEEEVELTDEESEEAGVTPDSPLWGLDRALERINLALTFGKSAKAKKGLAHARERLMEVKAMIAAKRIAQAEKAQKAHKNIMEDVTENVEDMGNGDGEQELADQVEIEEALAKNEEILNNIRLKVRGLSDEDKAQLEEVIGGLEGVTSEFKVKVQANKQKTMIKIKAEKGATDEEIAALEAALKEGKELAKVRIVKQGTGVIKERGKDKEAEPEGDEPEEDEDEKKGKGKGKGKDKGGDDEEDEPEDN